MGNFCIMRTAKLHSDGNVGGSVAHALRERETPNADTERTPKNWNNWTKNGDTAEAQKRAMAKYRELLRSTKARKNGVQAVELIMTVSPEVMGRKDFDSTKYMNACDKWAREKFGAENIFLIAHHRDETTPHTSILLVPRVEKTYKDGHTEFVLSAKNWLGGRKKLSELQSDFYEKVGKEFELERGIEGSRAKHQDIKKFYRRVESAQKEIKKLIDNLPEKKVLQSSEDYKKNITAQILYALNPIIQEAEKQEKNEARIKDLERIVKETQEQQKADRKAFESQNNALSRAIEEKAQQRAKELYKGLSEADKAEILKPYKWVDRFMRGETTVFNFGGEEYTCRTGKYSIKKAFDDCFNYESLTQYGVEVLLKNMQSYGFETVGDAREKARSLGLKSISDLPEKKKGRSIGGFSIGD